VLVDAFNAVLMLTNYVKEDGKKIEVGSRLEIFFDRVVSGLVMF
jgi:hypothetical protein